MQNRVKELRKERNILQEELAAKLNVSQLEYKQVSERNYQLCRAYERLDKSNQTLIFQLVEQLSKPE